MKRYNKYKPSGIEWLGDVPEHWEVKRVKDFGEYQSGYFIDANEFDTDNDYPVFGGNGLRGYACKYNHNGEYILIGRQGALCGNVNFASGKFWATEHAVVVYSKKSIHKKWYAYLLEIMNLNQYAISAAQPGLSVEKIRRLMLPYISFTEQTAIANYLDTKTAAFDRKIELLTAKADKYKALRRSLINETVCRGLNPNAPLKDSGIEWIGKIPEHWEVKRVKDEINIINGFAFDSESYLDSGLPIIRIGDISNEIDFNEVKFISKENAIQAKYSRIKKYDILMAMTGATIGKNSYFQSDRAAYLNQRVCSFRVQNDSIPAFVKYYIESRFIQDLILLVSGGSAQDNISKYQLENFYIIIPPKNEQVEIANYLDSKTSKIDTILTNINEQITKLTQLRKTLINDVVTGKLKVTD